MRTCSITQIYWIAHNFFNFDHNNRHVPPHFDRIDERNPTEEEFFKFELLGSHNLAQVLKMMTNYTFLIPIL